MGPTLPAGAMLAKVQLSVCAPTAPVTAQPAKAGDNDQLRSLPAGSGSLTVTLLAVPAPVLLTVTSKPMAVPDETGPAGLAVFRTCTEGQSIVTLAVEKSPPSLPEATVAVLPTVVQSALVVA